MNVDRLKRMASAVRTGGKGSARRKKVAHRATATNDKVLQSTLRRAGVDTIPGVEEVNMFFKDDIVIQFQYPKVQASIATNTWVVNGTPQTKNLQDLLPAFRY